MRLDLEKLKQLPESEQRRVLAAFKQAQKDMQANPLFAYHPHAKQAVFHASHDYTKMFVGGNRSGKSTAGIVDDILQAIDRDAVPEHLRAYKKWEPPFKCRIIVPDLTRTLEAVTETLRRWAPKDQLHGSSWSKAYDKYHRILTFKNGSFFDFMSAETDLDKFGGVERHRIHFDEEPYGEKGRRIWLESSKRLVDVNGDTLFTMTPEWGLSWTYEEIYERRLEDGITVVQVDMDENPHLSAEGKARFLAKLGTEEERKAFKEGKFIHFEGTFYKEFGEKHVTEEISREHLKDQTIVVGIDPGLHGTGLVWVAFDNDNSALVFDEALPVDDTVPPIAQLIKQKNAFWGVTPRYVIDPSARNRNAVNADRVEAAFSREGIHAEHGQNDRQAGILEVKRRLQNGSLTVARNCQRLIWEFPRYRKDPKGSDEFAAVKVNDDELDALRYALMSRAWHIPKPSERPTATPTFQPDFQRPYKDERPFHTEQPPMGALS